MFFQLFSEFITGILHLFLYFESSSFPKPLGAKEEREIFEELSNGCAAARDKLISHNLRLVAHIAKKYYKNPQEQDDFISIGTIGLIKAVNSFNADKGRFSSYAARCIENELLMSLRSAKKTSNTVFLGDLLENDSSGGGLTREDVAADDYQLSEIAEHNEEVEMLYNRISSRLEIREQQVLQLRYGLENRRPMSQQEVCEILGISRSYVSRIEKKALEKLREEFKGH